MGNLRISRYSSASVPKRRGTVNRPAWQSNGSAVHRGANAALLLVATTQLALRPPGATASPPTTATATTQLTAAAGSRKADVTVVAAKHLSPSSPPSLAPVSGFGPPESGQSPGATRDNPVSLHGVRSKLQPPLAGPTKQPKTKDKQKKERGKTADPQ